MSMLPLHLLQRNKHTATWDGSIDLPHKRLPDAARAIPSDAPDTEQYQHTDIPQSPLTLSEDASRSYISASTEAWSPVSSSSPLVDHAGPSSSPSYDYHSSASQSSLSPSDPGIGDYHGAEPRRSWASSSIIVHRSHQDSTSSLSRRPGVAPGVMRLQMTAEVDLGLLRGLGISAVNVDMMDSEGSLGAENDDLHSATCDAMKRYWSTKRCSHNTHRRNTNSLTLPSRQLGDASVGPKEDLPYRGRSASDASGYTVRPPSSVARRTCSRSGSALVAEYNMSSPALHDHKSDREELSPRQQFLSAETAYERNREDTADGTADGGSTANGPDPLLGKEMCKLSVLKCQLEANQRSDTASQGSLRQDRLLRRSDKDVSLATLRHTWEVSARHRSKVPDVRGEGVCKEELGREPSQSRRSWERPPSRSPSSIRQGSPLLCQSRDFLLSSEAQDRSTLQRMQSHPSPTQASEDDLHNDFSGKGIAIVKPIFEHRPLGQLDLFMSGQPVENEDSRLPAQSTTTRGSLEQPATTVEMLQDGAGLLDSDPEQTDLSPKIVQLRSTMTAPLKAFNAWKKTPKRSEASTSQEPKIEVAFAPSLLSGPCLQPSQRSTFKLSKLRGRAEKSLPAPSDHNGKEGGRVQPTLRHSEGPAPSASKSVKARSADEWSCPPSPSSDAVCQRLSNRSYSLCPIPSGDWLLASPAYKPPFSAHATHFPLEMSGRRHAAGPTSSGPNHSGHGGREGGGHTNYGGGKQSGQHNGSEGGGGGRGQFAGGGGRDGSGGGGGRQPNGGGPAKTSGGSRQMAEDVQTLFKRLELVGRGAYGAVYRGAHLPTGKIVALKVVNLDTPDDDVSDIQKEVAVLSQLREAEQKNVVRYWGCWLKGPELWIVMDYAEGGSIRTLMRGGPVLEQHAVIIVRETLVALAYLHKAGIIHRDIKAANILITNAGKILLCDFGVAASLVSSASKRTTFVGTPYWMAPEVITTGKSYDQSADIWSLGITIYEMVTGNPPLAEIEQMRAIMLIPKNKPPRLPTEGKFTVPMREFTAACLNEEAKERPNAEELSKSKWIKASAKTGTAILKELILAYTAWTKTGGMRMSLLGAEAADLDARRDSFAFDHQDGSDGWEFGTFRGELSQVAAYESPEQSAGRSAAQNSASMPRKDHPLLRLFQPDGPELDEYSVKTAGQPADRTAILANLDPKEIRPAPLPPPMQQQQPQEDNERISGKQRISQDLSGEPLVPPNAPFAQTGARPSTPTSADKPTFAGMGSSPFRFGAPTNNVAVVARRLASPVQVPVPLPGIRESSIDSPRAIHPSPEKKNLRHAGNDTPIRRQKGAVQGSSDVAEDAMMKLSGSPAESPSMLGRHQHQRTQSSVSLTSGHSKLSSGDSTMMVSGAVATSAINYGHPAHEAHPPPWMSTQRLRGGSTGSQLSDAADYPAVSLRNVTASPAAAGSSISLAPVVSTGAAAVPGGQPPTIPSLLQARARSGSRSRAGPGGDIGMPPVPAHLLTPAQAAVRPLPIPAPAKEHLSRLPISLDPELTGELLPPPPVPSNIAAAAAVGPMSAQNGGIGPSSTLLLSHSYGLRARKGSGSMRPSPLGMGGMDTSTHFRRQHGGSDPTLPPAPSSPLLHPPLASAPQHGSGNDDIFYVRHAGAAADLSPWTSSAHGHSCSQTPAYSQAGPPIRPLDLTGMQSREAIHLELARTVEDLGAWLDALAASLAQGQGQTTPPTSASTAASIPS